MTKSDFETRKAKTSARQRNLEIRIEAVVAVYGYMTFTVPLLAKMLDENSYDVLFSLHQLKSRGIIEMITPYIWKRAAIPYMEEKLTPRALAESFG